MAGRPPGRRGLPFECGRYVDALSSAFLARPKLVARLCRRGLAVGALQVVVPPRCGATSLLKEMIVPVGADLAAHLNGSYYLLGASLPTLRHAFDEMLSDALSPAMDKPELKGKPQVIMLDNCGRLDRRIFREILDLQRGHVEQRARGSLAFLNFCHAPILDRPYEIVEPLCREEVGRLLRRVLGRNYPCWSEGACDALLELSGGWPSMVQAIASAACARTLEAESRMVTATVVNEAAHRWAADDPEMEQLVRAAQDHHRLLARLGSGALASAKALSDPEAIELMNHGVLALRDGELGIVHRLLGWRLELQDPESVQVTTHEEQCRMSPSEARIAYKPSAGFRLFIDLPNLAAFVDGRKAHLTGDQIRFLACLLIKGAGQAVVPYHEFAIAVAPPSRVEEQERQANEDLLPGGRYRAGSRIPANVQALKHRLVAPLNAARRGLGDALFESCPGLGYRLGCDLTFCVIEQVG